MFVPWKQHFGGQCTCVLYMQHKLFIGGFFMWGAMYGKLAVGTVVLNSSLS